jgi:hypothetical protein
VEVPVLLPPLLLPPEELPPVTLPVEPAAFPLLLVPVEVPAAELEAAVLEGPEVVGPVSPPSGAELDPQPAPSPISSDPVTQRSFPRPSMWLAIDEVCARATPIRHREGTPPQMGVCWQVPPSPQYSSLELQSAPLVQAFSQ